MEDLFVKMVIEKARELNQTPSVHLSKSHETIRALSDHICEKQTLSQREIDKLIETLTLYTTLIPVPIPLHSGTVFSRAVKYIENDGGYCYNTPRRLSYIPMDTGIIPSQGRLNKKGESIFYGCLNADANSIGVILSETNAEKGEIFNLLQCRTKLEDPKEASDMALQVIPIGISDYFRRGVPPPFQLHETFQKIYELFKANLHPTAMLAMQLCDAFLTKSLKADKSARLYDVTSAIGSECLKPKELDGILYPSTEFDGFPNIALKPHSVDKKLRYEETLSVKVDDKFGYGMYKVTILAQGIVDSGSIHWSINATNRSVPANEC